MRLAKTAPICALLALVCASVLVSAQTQTPQTTPLPAAQMTFRATTDAVPVAVSVRSGKSTVSNLTAKDFELYDNGVRQEIQVVSTDALASDVTLVIDTSGSVVRSLNRFRGDVKKIADALRPGDRLRLMTFDTEVRQVFAMQELETRIPVERIQTGDLTSLVDAVVFALARGRQPARRHLIFVFTDGYDNASLVGYGALPDLAARVDAVLHMVIVKVTGAPDESSSPAFQALAAAATRTGGVYYPPADDTPDVVAAFKRALDAFRHSYVLYFVPKDVPRNGWHELKIKVSKAGQYEVQARQGYFGG